MSRDPFDRLSPRQRQCLVMVADLRTGGEIAGRLGITEATVKGYLAEAVIILGARDRREAARLFAARHKALEFEKTGSFFRVGMRLDRMLETRLRWIEWPVPLRKSRNEMSLVWLILWIVLIATAATIMSLIGGAVLDALMRAFYSPS